MTAKSLFTAYLADLESRRVSASALSDYRITTTRFIEWMADNDLDLADLNRIHIQEFFASSGWSLSTQHSRLTWLRSPFIFAVEDLHCLPHNPCNRVKLKPAPRPEIRTISSGDLRQMKADVRSPKDAALFAMLTYTGLRIGEVRGLTWDAISFANQTIWVSPQTAKGGQQRTLPLHPEGAKALDGLRMWANGSPYIFSGQRGGTMSRGGMEKAVYRITGHVYGDGGYTAHDFRHTVASSLEHNEAREAAIYHIMGWSFDASIRMRHYTAMPMAVLYREILKLYADDPI